MTEFPVSFKYSFLRSKCALSVNPDWIADGLIKSNLRYRPGAYALYKKVASLFRKRIERAAHRQREQVQLLIRGKTAGQNLDVLGMQRVNFLLAGCRGIKMCFLAEPGEKLSVIIPGQEQQQRPIF